jgi:hypothetical protein
MKATNVLGWWVFPDSAKAASNRKFTGDAKAANPFPEFALSIFSRHPSIPWSFRLI